MKSDEYLSILEAQTVTLLKEMEKTKTDMYNLSEEIQSLKGGDSLNVENFTEAQTKPCQKNKKKGFASIKEYIPGMGKFRPLSENNTGTLYLYCVGKVVDKDSHAIKKWIASLLGLVLACMQTFIIFVLYLEASHPRCTSMDDCPDGTYCTPTFFHLPACFDCKSVQKLKTNSTQCLFEFPEKWENWDLIDIDHIEFHIKAKMESSDLLNCVSFKHCVESDIDASNSFKGHCDFIYLNRSKMDKGIWLFIGFLAFLWSLPASQDIEEATIEERVLTYHIGDKFFVPAEILRLALRIRRFILPLMVVAATILLIITDEMSTKSVILDFLAVTFIMEADNALALFFLRASQADLIEKTVKDSQIETLESSKGIAFWSRVQGLACVIVMLTGLQQVDTIVKDCDNFDEYLVNVAMIPFFAGSIIQAFHRGFTREVQESVLMRITQALIIFFYNIVALLVTLLFNSISFMIWFGINGVYIQYVKKYYFLYIIAFLVFYLLQLFGRKCKDRSS